MKIRNNVIFKLTCLIFSFNFVRLNQNIKQVPYENLYDNEENYDRLNENSQFDYKKVSNGPCNIPVITAENPITQKEFLEKYAYNSPVIFKRTPEEVERNRIFTEKCQLDNLIKEYGEKFVTGKKSLHLLTKNLFNLMKCFLEPTDPFLNR